MASIAKGVRDVFRADDGIQEGAPKEVPAEVLALIEADEYRDGSEPQDLHVCLIAYGAAWTLHRVASPFAPGFEIAEHAARDAATAMVGHYGGEEVED